MNARDYRRVLDRALRELRVIFALLRGLGVPVTEVQRRELAVLMLPPVRRARSRTHRAALAYLAGQTILELPAAPPGYEIEAVLTMLERVVNTTIVGGQRITEANRSDPLVVQTVGKNVRRAAERHAGQPARDLVTDVADDTPGGAWARLLVGPRSCAFCAMLASRGPVYSSEATARGRRGGQKLTGVHDGCDCVFVLIQDYATWEGRRAHERLEQLWLHSTSKTGERSLNAFRRAYEAQIRSGESFMPDSLQRAAPAAA